MTITGFPLRDGPLLAKSRAEIVKAMAADLVRLDAWRNQQDAMRALLWQRDASGQPVFCSFEVSRYLDDARQAAMQNAVAKVMGAS
jgi:hypothetical protein